MTLIYFSHSTISPISRITKKSKSVSSKPSNNCRTILNATREDAPSIISPRGHRRSHYMRLKALLTHLRDETWDINADMHEVFNDLLTRENWELISAYELFLLNDDREELIDTLFVIYKIYSGSTMIDADLQQDQYDLRRSMEMILFNYKTKIEAKIFEKLVDLVKCNDKKTKDLHDQYRKDRDEKKFLAELSLYAQEKIKRAEEIYKVVSGGAKKPVQDDWRAELGHFVDVYSKSIVLPDTIMHKDLIEFDPAMSESIYLVKKIRKDYGDAIETLNILKNRHILGTLSFNLRVHFEVLPGINRIYHSIDKSQNRSYEDHEGNRRLQCQEAIRVDNCSFSLRCIRRRRRLHRFVQASLSHQVIACANTLEYAKYDII